jgi:radical SAM protein with 4Fe4S-binding SPASM domain
VPKSVSRGRFHLSPSLPERLTVEPVSYCNLACPQCPTGNGTLTIGRGRLQPAAFEELLDQFPDLKWLSLFAVGEPFLNKEIFELLAITTRRGIGVRIDSNLSLRLDDSFLRKILQSGLEVLQVSLDGASNETNAAYRRNGSFDLAFGNLRRLREIQKAEGHDLPRIYWKFTVNRFNEHEVETAREMAERIDVEFRWKPFYVVDDCPDVDQTGGASIEELKRYWLPTDETYLAPEYRGEQPEPLPCRWLFESAVIHTQGQVMPCCFAAAEESKMGSLREQSFEEIWSSPAYRYARSLFTGDASVPRVPVVCERCPILHAFQEAQETSEEQQATSEGHRPATSPSA